MGTEKSPIKTFSNERCSNIFARNFGVHRSPRVLCEACGRIHFEEMSDCNWEDGEYEELLQLQIQDPTRYISSLGGVDWGRFNGKQVVVDCPCGYAAIIEEVIWNSRWWIMDYLSGRALDEKATADQMASEVAESKKIIEQSV